MLSTLPISNPSGEKLKLVFPCHLSYFGFWIVSYSGEHAYSHPTLSQ